MYEGWMTFLQILILEWYVIEKNYHASSSFQNAASTFFQHFSLPRSSFFFFFCIFIMYTLFAMFIAITSFTGMIPKSTTSIAYIIPNMTPGAIRNWHLYHLKWQSLWKRYHHNLVLPIQQPIPLQYVPRSLHVFLLIRRLLFPTIWYLITLAYMRILDSRKTRQHVQELQQ